MRSIFIIQLFLIQYIIFLTPCKAQDNISVRQLPILDQLPSNSVYRILQDKDGYMWFGTQDGLCRYDGYQIKIFRSDLNNPDLLTSNEITSLSQDVKGNIWIGTNEGLNILDINTFKITKHPDKTLNNKYIAAIIPAKDSTIWVGYYNGIKRYDKNGKLLGNYSHNDNNPESIPDASINNIYEDTYQNIWSMSWGHGLYKFNKELNKFIKYPPIGKTDNPFSLFQDKKNNYWIGTWNDGLYTFSSNTMSEDMYKKIKMPSWIDTNNDKTFFSFIQDDYENYVWTMSMSGLSTFNYEDGKVAPINTQNYFKNTNNIFSEIIKDNKGNLWIGAFSEGVFMISFNKPDIINFPTKIFNNKYNIAPSFTTLCEDKDGNIWLNQNRLGLFVYSQQKQTIKSFTEIKELQNKTELHKISYISYISSLNEVWITNSVNDNVCKIGIDNNKIIYIKEFNLKEKVKSPGKTQAIFEDNNSNVWIGTSNNLFLQPNHKDEIILVKKELGSISSISQDINNNIWISTTNDGIYKFATPKNITKEDISKINIEKINNHIISNRIPSLKADLGGQIWIGTKEGELFAYNTADKSITNRTKDCGLSGEAILDIIVDKYNNIWVTTYKKIIEFNPKNNAYYVYSLTDGLRINSHLKGSYFKSQNSDYIYIAGNRGYSRFTPSKRLLSPPQKSQVKITDIKIQNETIYKTDKKHNYNNATNTLVLEPDDKNVEIYFSSLDYNNPKKIRYAYKLEGFDDEWVYLKNNRQYVLYSQLKKGKYIFKVKATDEHNLWGNQITEMTILKRPSFYETNIAISFYIILIFLIVYFLIRIVLNRAKLKNKIKMAQFEQHKSEELTQTKLKYFTNISHDLLTPLTIISCLVDDIEITSKKNKNQLSVMRSNVQRLKRLLQQILDFKRIDEGKMQLKITQSDIVAFIKDLCYNHFQPLLNKKHIKLEFNTSQKEISAFFDADKIDKVIFNILSNALKFTPEGGIVYINLKIKNDNNTQYLDVIIEDTGIGIEAKDLDKIFTRFYTNRNLSSSNTHGIGLSLCKDLIELHHGTISVESTPNKGTIFTITIPIDKTSYSQNEIVSQSLLEISDAEIIDNEPSSNEEPIDNNTKKTDINILLVEDILELLHLMKQILSKSYNILTCTNGKEALEIISTTDIPIIISDVMMPEMDGIELCKTLKNNIETSHISIILLTARNSINDRIECYNAGADAYISKPFEMKILAARINNFIANKQNKQKEFKSNAEVNISTLEYPSIDEQFLKNAIEIIEQNLAESKFDINAFAEELSMSKSSLYRKIKTITGLSPIEFIKNIKLKHASLMLKSNSSITISEVAYAVGFSDPKYFSSCFKAEFDITPSEFQKSDKRL